MRASDWMVGPELGEDRDHHPPDQVASVGVLGLAEHGLGAVERRLVVALVPRGERTGEGSGAVGAVIAGGGQQTGPRREALGREVTREAVQELERRVGFAALQKQPAEL